MPKYFDIHSHLNAPQFENDLEEVISRMKEAETHTIVVGTDLESSKKAVELAEKHREIYATVGIHPTDKLEVFRDSDFEDLVKSNKVVAIGECGFDFYHAEKEVDYERQRELFVNQIEFAQKYHKPLMIHARNAYEELLDIVREFEPLRGNIHFFTGSPEIAQRFFDLGFSISVTGVITFTHDYDEVVRLAPLDKLMTETDAPYATPVPHRGKRNEPVFVSQVARRIAEIRNEDFEVVRQALVNNAMRMIGS